MSEPSVPPSLRTLAADMSRVRGREPELRKIFDLARVPMLMVDAERRYVDANGPARLMLRLNMDELRSYRVDDLTPPHRLEALEQIWSRLLSTGSVAGSYEIAGADGSRFEVVYYALANAFPGLHLAAFTPAHWPDDELNVVAADDGDEAPVPLTARELEVLTLATQGYSGPEIARRLVVSPATVKTHFEHIYDKLGVRSRTGAVARAIQLGVLD